MSELRSGWIRPPYSPDWYWLDGTLNGFRWRQPRVYSVRGRAPYAPLPPELTTLEAAQRYVETLARLGTPDEQS